MYFVEQTKGLKMLKNFDFLLFTVVLVLSFIGFLVVKSATLSRVDGGTRIMVSQIIGLTIGVVLAVFISTIDYKEFRTLGTLFYIFSIFLLVAVLFIGTGDSLGSRSWIKLGSFSFQPSEIAKITYILVISIFLERIQEGSKDHRRNIIKLLVYTFIPIALIIAEHDFGTMAVFLFIFFVMVFICGINYKYIFIMIGTFLMTTPLLWFFVLNDKRKDRILVFLNPEKDPLGAGFNVMRSKMAIGSGQLFGKGLFHGIQTQNSVVPVKESDFIVSVIGEELGFVMVAAILVLIFFILLLSFFITDIYYSI
jgi:rod shape determining protein RodA